MQNVIKTMPKLKREQLEEHLLEKQFNFIELTVLDALFNSDWKEKWFLSQKQHNDWKKYCIKTLKKVLKINSLKAKTIFNDYLNKYYGLKIK